MGSWNRPGFDLYDPALVLYAPLWRPDMVARGGAIVNGTGTLSASPLNLAVGANTVSVTGLGTFTVYIPEGGTVASGTTTVSGSPVTVSAGIATSITTTGATGNITVTPSNIIRSLDRNNYALTATGTTWGSQGRTLNGTSDFIAALSSIAAHSFAPNSAFSVGAWVKLTTADASGIIIGKGILNKYEWELKQDTTGTGTIVFDIFNNGSGSNLIGRRIANIGTGWNGVWKRIVGTYDGSAVVGGFKIYANAVRSDDTNITAGTYTSMTDNSEPVRIGRQDNTYLDSVVGGVVLWNREITQSEVSLDFGAGRGRFGV